MSTSRADLTWLNQQLAALFERPHPDPSQSNDQQPSTVLVSSTSPNQQPEQNEALSQLPTPNPTEVQKRKDVIEVPVEILAMAKAVVEHNRKEGILVPDLSVFRDHGRLIKIEDHAVIKEEPKSPSDNRTHLHENTSLPQDPERTESPVVKVVMPPSNHPISLSGRQARSAPRTHLHETTSSPQVSQRTDSPVAKVVVPSAKHPISLTETRYFTSASPALFPPQSTSSSSYIEGRPSKRQRLDHVEQYATGPALSSGSIVKKAWNSLTYELDWHAIYCFACHSTLHTGPGRLCAQKSQFTCMIPVAGVPHSNQGWPSLGSKEGLQLTVNDIAMESWLSYVSLKLEEVAEGYEAWVPLRDGAFLQLLRSPQLPARYSDTLRTYMAAAAVDTRKAIEQIITRVMKFRTDALCAPVISHLRRNDLMPADMTQLSDRIVKWLLVESQRPNHLKFQVSRADLKQFDDIYRSLVGTYHAKRSAFQANIIDFLDSVAADLPKDAKKYFEFVEGSMPSIGNLNKRSLIETHHVSFPDLLEVFDRMRDTPLPLRVAAESLGSGAGGMAIPRDKALARLTPFPALGSPFHQHSLNNTNVARASVISGPSNLFRSRGESALQNTTLTENTSLLYGRGGSVDGGAGVMTVSLEDFQERMMREMRQQMEERLADFMSQQRDGNGSG